VSIGPIAEPGYYEIAEGSPHHSGSASQNDGYDHHHAHESDGIGEEPLLEVSFEIVQDEPPVTYAPAHFHINLAKSQVDNP